MKKERKWVSKIGSGRFTFNEKPPKLHEVFAGYPSFDIPYDEDVDIEKDSKLEMTHLLKVLKYSDKNPPKIDVVQARHICFYIVFESRDQKDKFLKDCDLYRLGDKYLASEDFASAFGIDLKKGIINKKSKKKESMKFPQIKFKNSFNFGQTGLNFIKEKKPEISEKLKGIREREKNLHEFLIWTSDTEYWICICFRTENEKENMLKALDLQLEFNNRYLWCYNVANKLNMELLPCTFPNKGIYTGKNKSLENFVE